MSDPEERANELLEEIANLADQFSNAINELNQEMQHPADFDDHGDPQLQALEGIVTCLITELTDSPIEGLGVLDAVRFQTLSKMQQMAAEIQKKPSQGADKTYIG